MTFPLRVPAELAADARAELLDRGRDPADAAFRFGYLLGVELDALPGLPALARLDGLLRQHVVAPDFELARLLINLAPTPRAFRYAAIDRFELARRGVSVPRSDYQVVELPADVPVEIVEIPPLEPNCVSALAFWASVVPHVGLDGPDGHFLASYEALAPR